MPNKQTRMTDEDFALIKAMFADNEANLKVLRKVFYPEKDDMNPIGMNFDMWSTLDLTGLDKEQQLIQIAAHQKLVRHVETVLQMLKTLAGAKSETPEETRQRLQQDSTK